MRRRITPPFAARAWGIRKALRCLSRRGCGDETWSATSDMMRRCIPTYYDGGHTREKIVAVSCVTLQPCVIYPLTPATLCHSERPPRMHTATRPSAKESGVGETPRVTRPLTPARPAYRRSRGTPTYVILIACLPLPPATSPFHLSPHRRARLPVWPVGVRPYGRLRISCVPMRRRITLSSSTSNVSR
jgi:hypothetical protein